MVSSEKDQRHSGQREPVPSERWERIAEGALLVLGLILFWPTLTTPFLFDDLMHSAMVEGTFVAQRSPIALYDFVNVVDRAAYWERGHLPWWSASDLTIRFFRPLASALRFVEQKAFGPEPVVMHVHSLLWWLASVLAVRRLFRTLLPSRVATIALCVFALGPWHVFPLAWIANREVLLTLTFGALALTHQARFQDKGRALDGALATAFHVLTLATGEYALCFAGYVVALEMFRSRGAWSRRALGVSFFAAPAMAYLLLRRALGFGTRSSSFYIDPLHQTGEFLAHAPARALRLLGEGWLTLGSNPWGTTLASHLVLALVAVGALVLAPSLLAVLAGLDEGRRRRLYAFGVGSLCALLPVLAVAPATRLLGASAIGMALVLAELFDYAWFGPGHERRLWREWVGAAATLFAFAHFVHGPARSWLSSRDLRASSTAFVDSARALAAQVKEPARTEFVVLRGMGGSFFGPFALDPRGVAPERWHVLSLTGHVLLLRTGTQTIELVAQKGASLYPCGRDNLFRDERAPLPAGTMVDIAGARVRVAALEKGCPSRVAVTFERPAQEIVWLQERFLGLERVELPAIGFGVPLDP